MSNEVKYKQLGNDDYFGNPDLEIESLTYEQEQEMLRDPYYFMEEKNEPRINTNEYINKYIFHIDYKPNFSDCHKLTYGLLLGLLDTNENKHLNTFEEEDDKEYIHKFLPKSAIQLNEIFDLMEFKTKEEELEFFKNDVKKYSKENPQEPIHNYIDRLTQICLNNTLEKYKVAYVQQLHPISQKIHKKYVTDAMNLIIKNNKELIDKCNEYKKYCTSHHIFTTMPEKGLPTYNENTTEVQRYYYDEVRRDVEVAIEMYAEINYKAREINNMFIYMENVLVKHNKYYKYDYVFDKLEEENKITPQRRREIDENLCLYVPRIKNYYKKAFFYLRKSIYYENLRKKQDPNYKRENRVVEYPTVVSYTPPVAYCPPPKVEVDDEPTNINTTSYYSSGMGI